MYSPRNAFNRTKTKAKQCFCSEWLVNPSRRRSYQGLINKENWPCTAELGKFLPIKQFTTKFWNHIDLRGSRPFFCELERWQRFFQQKPLPSGKLEGIDESVELPVAHRVEPSSTLGSIALNNTCSHSLQHTGRQTNKGEKTLIATNDTNKYLAKHIGPKPWSGTGCRILSTSRKQKQKNKNRITHKNQLRIKNRFKKMKIFLSWLEISMVKTLRRIKKIEPQHKSMLQKKTLLHINIFQEKRETTETYLSNQ